MRIPGLKTVVKTARLIRSRFVRPAMILGYHRVAEIDRDPYDLNLSPASFESQLRLLSEVAHPLRLRDLVASLRVKQIPRNGVVITFDDGYADVLYNALPLLEKYRIPATIFITTGELGQEFWWDELERIIFESETLPETLSLSNQSDEFVLGTAITDRRQGFTSKYHLLKSLHRWIQSLSNHERKHVLHQLREWSGVNLRFSPYKRALTTDEIITLSQHDLIDVGAHSVSHMSLTLLPEQLQRKEVLHSKLMLEELLGQPINAFSFPSGIYSNEVKTLVASAGFDCACSSANDIVWYGSDPFELPRFWPQHYNEDQFARWLTIWLTRN